MRHINFLHDITNQCPFIRVYNPLNHINIRLTDVDIHCHVNPKEIDELDTAVFERPVAPNLIEMQKELYSYSKAPVLMEMDDLVWKPEIYKETSKANFDKGCKLAEPFKDLMANHCDGIIVSTEYIGREAMKVTDKPILVLPNAVDPTWAPTAHNKIVMYAGAGDRSREFSDEWIKAIKDMQKRGYKFVSTTKFGWEDEHLPTVPTAQHYNRLRYYAPEYYIAPLKETELNKGRSNLKELEAASIGAKFVGGTNWVNGYNVPDFDNAKVPTLNPENNLTTAEYAANFTTAYSGLWLMSPEKAAEWKAETKLGGGK